MIVIAIPTFERSDICLSTLKIINQLTQFPIFIFVSNPIEEKIYQNKIPKYMYQSLITTYTIGLAQKRNFISNFFDEGQFILQIDDDIEELCQMIDRESKKHLTADYFDTFCLKMFDLCKSHSTKLWGIYPLSNPYFMNDSIWIGKFYIVGAFFGVINDKQIQITNCLQEDKQRSLLFAKKYNHIVRCNFVGIKTKYWKNKGGMQSINQLPDEIRNPLNIFNSIQKLKLEFPDDVVLKQKTNNDKFPDIRLKKKIFLRTNFTDF
jgi:hypothetical protein